MSRYSSLSKERNRHQRSSDRSSYSNRDLTEEQRARRSILISNIPRSLTKKHLVSGFSVLGAIIECNYRDQNVSGASLSCCITYDKPISAIQAVTCINNHFCHGSQLNVSMIEYIKPKIEADTQISTGKESFSSIFVTNIDPNVDSKSIENLFSAFGKISLCKVQKNEGSELQIMSITFTVLDSGLQAISAMNGFSLKGRRLRVLNEQEYRLEQAKQKLSLSLPITKAIGYVEYKPKNSNLSLYSLTSSCITLVTGFSDVIDIKEPSTINELKRIALEQGKLKDMKYVEINGEKRLFFKFANSYSASIAAKGISGLLFNSCRLHARQYDSKLYQVNNYSA